MGNVFKVISDVQKDLATEGVGKTDRNDHGRYNFRGIDSLYNALAPLLAKHGLVIIPSVLGKEVRQVQTSGGKTTNHWTVDVSYTLADSSDGNLTTTKFTGEAYDTSDKGLNKALTAAYKYLCFELFCIPTEGSDDADAVTHEVADTGPLLTDAERHEILGLCMQSNTNVDGFVTWLGYNTLTEVPQSERGRAFKALNKKLQKLSDAYEAEQKATALSLEGETR